VDEKRAVPRIGDVYAALPMITGKLELEYEGELKGGEAVAKDIVRRAIEAPIRQIAVARHNRLTDGMSKYERQIDHDTTH
jgi:magnesium chelatase subunit I